MLTTSTKLVWIPLIALLALTTQEIKCLTSENRRSCAGSKVSLENARVYRQVTPRGNTSSGRFVKIPQAKTLEDCALECCEQSFCNVVFTFQTTCYLIECASEELCEPVHREGQKFTEAYMIPLRSVSKESFDGILNENTKSQSTFSNGNVRSVLRSESLLDDFAAEEVDVNERKGVARKMTMRGIKACEVGIIEDCPAHEDCKPKNSRSRQGLCACVEDFAREESGKCVRSADLNETTPSAVPSSTITISASTITSISSSTQEAANVKKLVVSAGNNKQIQLPENEVTLSAFAVSAKKHPAGSYHYEWTLVSHPDGDDSGTMGDKNLATLKLTSLKEGLYTFKVAVSIDDEYGEATVNLTVLPLKRINKPPVAKINPVNQTVKLPNTDTVLDGSASSDDNKIVKYHWEQITAPINNQPDLTDTATLQLKNLLPGFYRFKLVVTDSDGATDSTFANVTVIKEVDYPPVANAGPDAIIYLPQNEVVLSGNLSTDDKGIKSWEWMKGPDINKAVDMQNTHTPFLRLSSLEVGMYTFILKVTDTADQTAETEVHVFVKPETNETPVAEVGPDLEINLPIDTVVLDGSKSHDNIGIKEWQWKQLSGPNQAKLDSANQSKTNASGLTKGIYVFQLTVTDDTKATDSKTLRVAVKQTENIPPKANAGGDKIIQLPVSVVTLDGSASTDDLGITSYQWIREASSLAAGVVLEDSDQSPYLKLSNLIPGRYIFQLKVIDNQGASSTDTASVIVKPDAHENDYVEMLLNADIFWFNEEQKVTLAKKLALLLHDEGEVMVRIRSVDAARYSGRVILVFCVERIMDNDISVLIKGPDVVRKLKKKLQSDNSLLDFDVLTLDTLICQNNCSSHGSCDQASKRCICEAFWMENFFRFHFNDQESNCDWSVLYVIIILFLLVISALALLWAFICFCRRLSVLMRFRRPRKRHRYTLLENTTEREQVPVAGKGGKNQLTSLMMSDSDMESDTLFEQKCLNGKVNGHSNGIIHHPRKVKT